MVQPPATAGPVTTTIVTAAAAAAVVVQPQPVTPTPPPAVPVTPVNIVSTPPVPEVRAEEVVEEMELNSSGIADGTGEEMGVEKVATAIFKDPNFVVSLTWFRGHDIVSVVYMG